MHTRFPSRDFLDNEILTLNVQNIALDRLPGGGFRTGFLGVGRHEYKEQQRKDQQPPMHDNLLLARSRLQSRTSDAVLSIALIAGGCCAKGSHPTMRDQTFGMLRPLASCLAGD